MCVSESKVGLIGWVGCFFYGCIYEVCIMEVIVVWVDV